MRPNIPPVVGEQLSPGMGPLGGDRHLVPTARRGLGSKGAPRGVGPSARRSPGRDTTGRVKHGQRCLERPHVSAQARERADFGAGAALATARRFTPGAPDFAPRPRVPWFIPSKIQDAKGGTQRGGLGARRERSRGRGRRAPEPRIPALSARPEPGSPSQTIPGAPGSLLVPTGAAAAAVPVPIPPLPPPRRVHPVFPPGCRDRRGRASPEPGGQRAVGLAAPRSPPLVGRNVPGPPRSVYTE